MIYLSTGIYIERYEKKRYLHCIEMSIHSFGEPYIYCISVRDEMSKEYLMKFIMSVYVRHCLMDHIAMRNNVLICISIEICRTNKMYFFCIVTINFHHWTRPHAVIRNRRNQYISKNVVDRKNLSSLYKTRNLFYTP